MYPQHVRGYGKALNKKWEKSRYLGTLWLQSPNGGKRKGIKKQTWESSIICHTEIYICCTWCASVNRKQIKCNSKNPNPTNPHANGSSKRRRHVSIVWRSWYIQYQGPKSESLLTSTMRNCHQPCAAVKNHMQLFSDMYACHQFLYKLKERLPPQVTVWSPSHT